MFLSVRLLGLALRSFKTRRGEESIQGAQGRRTEEVCWRARKAALGVELNLVILVISEEVSGIVSKAFYPISRKTSSF